MVSSCVIEHGYNFDWQMSVQTACKWKQEDFFTGMSHTLTLFGAESWFACRDYWASAHKELDSISSAAPLAHSEKARRRRGSVPSEMERGKSKRCRLSLSLALSFLLTVSLVLLWGCCYASRCFPLDKADNDTTDVPHRLWWLCQ